MGVGKIDRPEVYSTDHELIGRLTSLFVAAVTFIGKGRRSASQINALFRALRLFKDNELGLVKSDKEVRGDGDPSLHILPQKKDRGPSGAERERQYRAAWSWAHAKVDAVVKGTQEILHDDPSFIHAAHFAYTDQPPHQCYWNDRFCIAVMCDMDWELQRLAAWCAVSNGMNGYWEWNTHTGYDVAHVLKRIGLLPEGFVLPPHGPYSDLRGAVSVSIIHYFNLPTTIGGVKKRLNEADLEERDRFNHTYPYASVL